MPRYYILARPCRPIYVEEERLSPGRTLDWGCTHQRGASGVQRDDRETSIVIWGGCFHTDHVGDRFVPLRAHSRPGLCKSPVLSTLPQEMRPVTTCIQSQSSSMS